MPDFLFYFIMWKYLLIFDSFLNTQKENFFKYCKQMEHQPSSVEVMLSSCRLFDCVQFSSAAVWPHRCCSEPEGPIASLRRWNQVRSTPILPYGWIANFCCAPPKPLWPRSRIFNSCTRTIKRPSWFIMKCFQLRKPWERMYGGNLWPRRS